MGKNASFSQKTTREIYPLWPTVTGTISGEKLFEFAAKFGDVIRGDDDDAIRCGGGMNGGGC